MPANTRPKTYVAVVKCSLWPDSFEAPTNNLDVRIEPGEVVRVALTAFLGPKIVKYFP